jgi:hypothetical protein
MNTVRIRLVLYALIAIGLSYAAGSLAQDAKGSSVLTPSDLRWSESPRAPGVATAPLLGDPTKAGPYVFRAKYPPNTVNRPHHHPGDEEITVLSGTLYFGDGMAMEEEKTRVLPAGSYIAVPAKSWHFLFTKSEGVELEIRGLGPRANIFAK